MTLLEKIKHLCVERRISLSRLEAECGVKRGNISRWDKHEPTLENIRKVAAYFGVSVDWLADETSDRYGVSDTDIKFALFGGGEITDEMYEEVKRFAQWVKAKNDRPL